ncbi:O-antigen ligase [Desulfovibrio sp. X2]|uniref:O-antigen ligase family protein n=1 Tax=Desulfovibrio sp. X2 TaxID=941449 RepID=UPI000A03BB6D|nr:O-antigen ligase family protein [Desulfovibrio sp. X2]
MNCSWGSMDTDASGTVEPRFSGWKPRLSRELARVSRIGLLFYLALFPFGMSLREIGGWTATIGVLLFYMLDFRSSNARMLGRLFWIFPAFWAFLAFKSVDSISPGSSWYVLRSNLHMGFGLFFAGLEFVRTERDIRLPVYAMVVCGFMQGLDGVWQAISGKDLIHGTAPMGGKRLTGSFSTYRVGNLISLYLPPMAGLFWALPKRIAASRRLLLTVALLLPPLFLLIGARTRSAVVGTAVALMVSWAIMKRSWWKGILLVAVVCAGVMFLGPHRFTVEGVLQDDRIRELWPFALRVFAHWPFLGSGINTYNAAFRSLGLRPMFEHIDIPHPHNIYLQLLCETGVIGLVLFAVLVFLFLRHALRRIVPQARAGLRWWRVAALFVASYVGYLGTAVSGHSFFRNWWLGTATLLLGLTLGYCAASSRPHFASPGESAER